MSALQDAVTFAQDYALWRHECPFVGASIDERDRRILECRCFEGRRFLAIQDAIATGIDPNR